MNFAVILTRVISLNVCVLFVIPQTDWSVIMFFRWFEQCHYHSCYLNAIISIDSLDLIYRWTLMWQIHTCILESGNFRLQQVGITAPQIRISQINECISDSLCRKWEHFSFPPSSTKEECNAYNNNKNDDFRAQAFFAFASWLLPFDTLTLHV